MPAYHIERSIRIAASEDKVRPAIEDFEEWPKWSPWLCMEPTATVKAFGTPGTVGHGYDWEGTLVGAGGMKIASNEGQQLKMDLNFLKPFKSKAQVMMEVVPVGENETDVTWHMDGKLPFFLFFMVGMMKVMIGMDYQRGLRMLKEYVETGGVNSSTEIVGVVDVPAAEFVGIADECSMDDIGESMGKTLPAALELAQQNDLEMAGAPGAIYHRVDFKNQSCHYTAMIPVTSADKLQEDQKGAISPCRAIKIVHKGSYHHLGNAWSTAMAYQRNQKMKLLKSQAGFERYLNDPSETPESELITEIYVPVRG